jgi:hypothetical protein
MGGQPWPEMELHGRPWGSSSERGGEGETAGGYRRRLGAAVLWFDLPVPWGRKEKKRKNRKIAKPGNFRGEKYKIIYGLNLK